MLAGRCRICNQERQTVLIYCDNCAPGIPPEITELIRAVTEPDNVLWQGAQPWTATQPGYPDDVGFTFDKTNWMFFSKVVDRLVQVGDPLEIQIINKSKVIKSIPARNEMLVRYHTSVCGGEAWHTLKEKAVNNGTIEVIGPPWLVNLNQQQQVQTVSKDYPHKCKRCGAPAYEGLRTIDCSKCGVCRKRM